MNLKQPRALCSESPSHSPKCCQPTQWRQLNHKEILRGEHDPKKQQRWTARKRTTTKSPGHAGLLQTQGNMLMHKPRPALVLPEPHCSSRSACVLKASTKNPGLTPLTHPLGHSNLKVEPRNKATATWRASAKQADPAHLEPRTDTPF